MPNDNTHTLPPCPFCGTYPDGFGQTLAKDGKTPTQSVRHPDNGCCLSILVFRIEDWNTRTPAEPKDCLIWCGERSGYWLPEGRGYTDDLSKAWRVTRSYADSICASMGPEKQMQIRPAPAEPKAGDWGLRTWLEGQISILDRMLGESTSHSEQMNIGFARKAYEDVLIRMKPVENDPLHNEGWDADFFIASEVMPRVSKVKGTIYIEDATHFIKEAVRRALSSAAPRITDVGSLQRYRLGLRVVDGIAEAPILEEDPNGSLVAFNHVLDLIAPAPLPGITAERIKSALDKAWRETMDGEPADFYRALWIRIKRELRLAMSPAPLSGITEEMVGRVHAEVLTECNKGGRPFFDAPREIKDRLIALLRQQAQPPFTPTQTEE